ncbi:MAG: GntP family permease [Actinomycetaceae bacterium]
MLHTQVEWEQSMGDVQLLLIAAAAIAVVLLLVIALRLHAFLTLIIVSMLTAIATGIPLANITDVILDGFGGTLAEVALLVGLGAMLGKLVEHSGGAQVLAESLVRAFGEKRAPLALGVASLVMGFPMFFDAGLVVMLPIIFAIARRLDQPVLLYGITAAAAFSVMHVFVPPHPGPVAAVGFYDASLGLVLLVGLVVAIPTFYVAGYMWAKVAARRFPFTVDSLTDAVFGEVSTVKSPPRVATVVGVLAVPVVLIFLNTGLDFARSAGWADDGATWFQALRLLGTAPVALIISVVVAALVLGRARGERAGALEKLLDSSLGPIASVVLITGAGGMFGGVLQASGIGEALERLMGGLGLPVIVGAFLVAAVLRIAQGSATVALTTTAALMASSVAEGDYSSVQVAAVVIATAAGSVIASHVNDSGFWLVGRLMGMDVKTTLQTWTVQQTLQALVAFAVAFVIYLVF